MYPGFHPKVRELLIRCHETGLIARGELDERVLEDLKALSEKGLSFLPDTVMQYY